LQNYAKNFFTPVLVSAFETTTYGGDFEVHVINDLTRDIDVIVSVNIYIYSTSALVKTTTFPVATIDKLWSIRVFQTKDITTLFDSPDAPRNERVLVITATDAQTNDAISTNVYYPSSFHDVHLVNPELSITTVQQISTTATALVTPPVTGLTKRFNITIKAPAALALFIQLQTPNILPGTFSDNGFLLLRDQTREIEFTITEDAIETRRVALEASHRNAGSEEVVLSLEGVNEELVRRSIRVRSLWDVKSQE